MRVWKFDKLMMMVMMNNGALTISFFDFFRKVFLDSFLAQWMDDG